MLIICLLILSFSAVAFSATRTIGGNYVSIIFIPETDDIAPYFIQEIVSGATVIVDSWNPESCGYTDGVLTCNHDVDETFTLSYITTGTGTVLGEAGGLDSMTFEAIVVPILGDVEIPNEGTCTPDCAGKICGADGCGGSCGECEADVTTCSFDGLCVPISVDPITIPVTVPQSAVLLAIDNDASLIEIATELKVFFASILDDEEFYYVINEEKAELLTAVANILNDPNKSKLQKVSLVAYELMMNEDE